MPDIRSRDEVDEDALDLLATDRDEIAELFDRYERLASDEASASERRTAAEEICTLLLVHAAIKEEIFYPAVRLVLDDETLVDEALVALESVRALVDDVQSGDPTEPSYDRQLQVLHELVAQHFDEERSDIFPRVRRTALDLEELGGEIAARQEELLLADTDELADAG